MREEHKELIKKWEKDIEALLNEGWSFIDGRNSFNISKRETFKFEIQGRTFPTTVDLFIVPSQTYRGKHIFLGKIKTLPTSKYYHPHIEFRAGCDRFDIVCWGQYKGIINNRFETNEVPPTMISDALHQFMVNCDMYDAAGVTMHLMIKRCKDCDDILKARRFTYCDRCRKNKGYIK